MVLIMQLKNYIVYKCFFKHQISLRSLLLLHFYEKNILPFHL